MHKFPRLYTYLTTTVPQEYNITTAELLDPVFTSLFTGNLSLDNVTRLWDIWVFEGDAVLVRAGIALLGALEGELYAAVGRREVKGVFELSKSKLGNVVSVDGEVGSCGEDDWIAKVREAGKC